MNGNVYFSESKRKEIEIKLSTESKMGTSPRMLRVTKLNYAAGNIDYDILSANIKRLMETRKQFVFKLFDADEMPENTREVIYQSIDYVNDQLRELLGL
jgi:NAD+--asparagine ADP-ribosyltransferase